MNTKIATLIVIVLQIFPSSDIENWRNECGESLYLENNIVLKTNVIVKQDSKSLLDQ